MKKPTYTRSAIDALAVAIGKAEGTKTAAVVAFLNTDSEVKASGFDKLSAADKRKALDTAKDAVKSRIDGRKDELSAEDKAAKDDALYQALRKAYGLVSAIRSGLRTDSEKTAAKEEAAARKAKAEDELKKKLIESGELVEVETSNASFESLLFAAVEAAVKRGVKLEKFNRLAADTFGAIQS